VKNLPHYMKLCFLALYNTVNEMVYDTLKEKGENTLPYLTKVVYICSHSILFIFYYYFFYMNIISFEILNLILLGFLLLIQWADMCKAFLQEAKWRYNKDMPTFKDYIDNAWLSVSGAVFLVHAYFVLNQKFTEQALEGIEKYCNLLRWPSIIFRLCNDLSTSAV
jgi:isoprene synthase